MEQLGIQLPVLVTQVVNFVILAALLWKFLYKPVIKNLDARKKQLENDQKLSQSLKESQADQEENHKKILKAAHVQAQEILAVAKKEAKLLRSGELDQAKVEISKERVKLLAELDAAKTKLRSELKHEAIDIAISLTKKVLSESLDADSHSELIQTALLKFSKLNAK